MGRVTTLAGRRPAGALLVLALAFAAFGALAATAPAAAAPELFWKNPEDGVPGGEAGRFNTPSGIATDPGTGHVFVADFNNARLVELTAWGEFVKAWGWGVVASGPGNEPAKNERQRLSVSATSGSYQLIHYNTFDPPGTGPSIFQVTVPIPFDASAIAVQEALEGTESLGPGDLTVSGPAGGPYEIEFLGRYSDFDVPPLEVDATGLSGSAAVATLQGGGSFEICVPAEGDSCRAGQRGGNRPGQLPAPFGGVDVDTSGNVYVYETLPESRGEGRSYRVQKFDAGGEFEAMWGGEVNKTKAAEIGSSEAERNLCTRAQVEGGDVCGTGVPGLGNGQFQHTPVSGNRIAVGPTGTVFVGDVGRIEAFSAGGAFLDELKAPGETIRALAVDETGSFYASFAGKANVRKLVPAGEGVAETMLFPAELALTLAVDGSGNVYIVNFEGSLPGERDKVIAYEADGTPLITHTDHFAESGRTLGGLGISEACGIPGTDLYVADFGGSLSAYGPPPSDLGACPPPQAAPVIGKQFASAVGTDSATVVATINPKFWNDTRYYVEYGTEPCGSGGCTNTQPLAPGSLLTDRVTNQPLRSAGVYLSGLAPNNTYHYRFVVASSGGGPVIGPEMSFTTPARPTSEADSCTNAAFRGGAGARLPDCRAYELVSPVDKRNGDISVLEKGGVAHAPLSLNQSSPDGSLLTYSSYRAFGGAQSAPITSTYLASRGSGGWTSEGISPPRGRNIWQVADSINTHFKAFSEDLCSSWLISETDLPLTEGAPADYANLYRRDNCGPERGSYEALIGSGPAPGEIEPKDFKPEVQGVSDDGEHTLFQVRGQVSEGALPCAVPGDIGSCTLQLYESLPDGGLSFVCVLPGGEAPPDGCSAGSASGGVQNDGRSHMVDNAISVDGSRIFWSDRAVLQGKIYVRIGGAITQPVSAAGEALSGSSQSQYWTAADDGSTAIFSVAGPSERSDLYEYVVDGEETNLIAGRFYGLLGASEDADWIYLVSGEDLDAGATEGQPNLYLYEAEAESFSFIGTLTKSDATAGDSVPYSPVNLIPRNHVAQVSADGQHVAFMSSAPLTGRDNADANSGEPNAQVFLYGAAEDRLRCVSCNPTGAQPAGRNVGGGRPLWAAAQIPVTQTQIYQAPKVLSTDGTRLYFESFEALEAADTNGRKDVYQWEEAGTGSCTETASSYNPAAEGCVELISSGTGEEDSSLVDVSASGNDVFFATAQSLVSWDPGLIDIYDARVGGGFPSPPTPRPPCEGEACQSPPAPPQAPTPASAGFRGAGNPKPPAKARKRCPKGKRKVRQRSGKSRCVAKGRGAAGRGARR